MDQKQKLELEKMKLESDIRIQKERNKNAKENKIIKNKNLIENKRQHLEEMNQNKKSRLTLKNKNDINNLEKEFKNNYEKYVEQYKNDYLKNKEDVNNDDYILRNNLKELEDEYIKELKEKFEQEKISIKYEVETNMFKELEKYKIQMKNNNEQKKQEYDDKINYLSKEYFNERDAIKKQIDIQKNKDDLIINEKLKNISNTYFNEMKNIYLKKLNEEMNQINSIIKKQNNNYNIEDYDNLELKIEEKLIDKFVVNNSKLRELKSLYDLSEKDYNEIKMKIEFITKAVYIINKLLIEKGSDFIFELNDVENKNKKDNKDDLLVSEMVYTLQNKLDELKIKDKDDLNKKIYPFLDEEINNLMDNINKSKERNIMRSNYNYTSFRTNNINYNNNNNNNEYNDYIKLSSQFKYNPLILSNQEKKNTKKSFFKEKNNNNYININNNNYTINNKITEESIEKENGSTMIKNISNYKEITNLELPNEILNTFSEELLYLYNKIVSFINEESTLIKKDKENLNNHENMNNTLKSLKDNNNFIDYKNDFNFVISQEQKTSRIIKANIESKIRLFNKIKSSWEDTLYFIYNNYSRHDYIKRKLNLLIENIDDYMALDNSKKKNIFEDNNYIMTSRNNNNFVYNSNILNGNNRYNLRYGKNTFRNSSYDKKYN